MCGPTCAAPEDTVMTCDDCTSGIAASADQLVLPETIDQIVADFTAEDGFCASSEIEGCAEKIDYVLRNGLPMLVLGFNPADGPTICNTAVEGTCPARRARLI